MDDKTTIFTRYKRLLRLGFWVWTVILWGVTTQNLQAQTVTFDDQSFAQGNDVTSAIAAGVNGIKITFQLSNVTQTTGVTYDEDNGIGGSGAIIPAFSANQKYIIEKVDGTAFRLNSFYFEGGFGSNGGVTLQGFNGASSTGTQGFGAVGAGSSINPTLNTNFNNVTRVEITDNGAGFGFDGLFDQFVIQTAVASNAAPTAANFTANPSEDLVYTFSTGDFSYSDGDSDPLDHVLIEVAPSAGTPLHRCQWQ